jgi:WD40 repeat protein
MHAQTHASTRLKVFISYSRQDGTEFADQLEDALLACNFEPMLDRHAITGGEEWQNRLRTLILSADTILFVLTPGSVASEMCAWEVGEAERLSKRILPVVSKPLGNRHPPAALARLNYIYFYEVPSVPRSGFGSGLAQLVAALNTNVAWLREHTRLQTSASEWVARQRPEHRLLTGSDIVEAKAWAADKPDGAPDPTPLQLEFIKASEARGRYLEDARQQELAERERLVKQAEAATHEREEALRARGIEQQRRGRLERVLAGGAMLASIALGAFGLQTWSALLKADNELEKANIARSRFLAEKASIALNGGDAGTALLLALEALPADRSKESRQPEIPEAKLIGSKAERALLEGNLYWGKDGPIRSLELGRSGNVVLITAQGRTAHLWDYSTGKQVELNGHSDEVTQGRFSPDGRRIVTVSRDKTAIVWDATTAQLTSRLLGHSEQIRSVDIAENPQRRLLAVTASLDKTARIWDVETGIQLAELPGATKGINTARFSKDGSMVAVGSRDGSVRLWDVTDIARGARFLYSLEGHREDINSVTFDPSGTLIVSTSDDRTARLWSTRTGELIGKTFDKHEGAVNGAIFSPDGGTLLTWSRDGVVIAWLRREETDNWIQGDTYKDHKDEIKDLRLCSTGERFVTASADRTARIWSLAQSKPLAVLRGHASDIMAAAFSTDCGAVLTGSSDGTVRVWSAAQKSQSALLSGHSEHIHGLAFSPDSSLLASASGSLQMGGGDYSVRIWSLKGGEWAAKLPPITHAGAVNSVAFSPDGSKLVSTADDKMAHIIDATTGKFLQHLRGHEKSVRHATFDRQGRRVVTASRDGSLMIFDTSNGELLDKLSADHVDRGWANSAVINRDGKIVAAGYRANAVVLWNLESRKFEFLDGHSSSVFSVAFSPDGKLLASAANDSTIILWDVEKRTNQRMITGHDGGIWSVAFSPDGKRLVTASQDGTVSIWSTEKGEELELFEVSQRPVRAAAFSPDGTQIAAGGETVHNPTAPAHKRIEALIRLYSTAGSAASQFDVAGARKRIKRCLTASQRGIYHLEKDVPTWCDQSKWHN